MPALVTVSPSSDLFYYNVEGDNDEYCDEEEYVRSKAPDASKGLCSSLQCYKYIPNFGLQHSDRRITTTLVRQGEDFLLENMPKQRRRDQPTALRNQRRLNRQVPRISPPKANQLLLQRPLQRH